LFNNRKRKDTMKKILIALIFATVFTLAGNALLAQGAPPPPPSGHGSGTNQPAGGGAPVGSGIVILLALGGVYGTRKIYKAHKDI
jgi:hypothetical protein